ncbi:hypothetical protein SNEBB_000602 [Seison nebaliae]|nr:hypothetical protein SNEBB_000602 [Seison nebaliae]
MPIKFEDVVEFYSSLPAHLKSRVDANEFINGLFTSMNDDNVIQTIFELYDLQYFTETKLWEARQSEMKKLDESSSNYISIEDFNERKKEVMKQIDLKIIQELDRMIFSQQTTLNSLNVPAFKVTNTQNDVQLQIEILEFLNTHRKELVVEKDNSEVDVV